MMLSTLCLLAQVTTAQYDNARTGATTKETVLTPAAVSAPTFGRVATLAVDGDVYAQPLLWHDLLIVATEHNSLYAFDTKTLAPKPVWRVSLNGGSGNTPLSVRNVMCPFIRPEIGITPTPVIDSTTGSLYVLVRTVGPYGFEQYLHKLDVRSGRELTPPRKISARVRGSGGGSRGGNLDFDPLRENPRAALLLDRGVVYLSWASSCDVGPYHGWVMAYDAATLKQRAVFNTSPDGDESGIWQGDAGLAADSAGHVYAVTGNGSFDESPAHRRNWGTSVLQLTLHDSTLVVRQHFTPPNQAALSKDDQDLGSSGAVLLPGPASHPALIVVAGKDGTTWLIDRDKMGGYNPEGPSGAVQGFKTSEGGFGAAAYWNHTVYLWGSNNVLKAFAVTDTGLALKGQGTKQLTDPGATPVISANGDKDGIVWAVETHTWNGEDQIAVLHAYDANDVARELWNSAQNGTRDQAGTALRFAMPTVAAGKVYLGTKNEVDVYGLLR